MSSTESGWVLTNARITYAIAFDAAGDLVLQDLRRTGDTLSWRPAAVRDTVFRLEDCEMGLTRNNAAGFRHVGAEVTDTGVGLELRLTFEDLRDGLRARRVYAIHPQVALDRDVDRARVDEWPIDDGERHGLAPAGRRRRPGDDRRRSRRAGGERRGVRGAAPRRLRRDAGANSRSVDDRRSATCRWCRWRRRAARSSPG